MERRIMSWNSRDIRKLQQRGTETDCKAPRWHKYGTFELLYSHVQMW